MLDTCTSIYKPRSNKKSTTEEFIKKAILVHGDKYDYSKVDYKRSRIKVIIICPIHGDFEQKPNHHLSGGGCPKCANDEKRSSTKEFIQKAILVHGDKYDYSKVDYKTAKSKVIIVCPINGEFEQRPDQHLSGCGCQKCKADEQRSSTEEFIKKAILVHGDKYDYSKVDYKRSRIKVIIICPIHGEFEQVPNHHLSGGGCLKCANDEYRSSTEEFIKKAVLIHGDKYDYSKVDYKRSLSKVVIICPIHGEFEQTPNNHLSGYRCQKCANDETRVRNGIRFEDTYDVATIYLLKCYNDSEVFLKIGITSKTIEKRYSGKISMPYNRETLFEWRGDSNIIVDIEYKIKTKFTYHKPEIMFDGGHTETLYISQEKAILKFLSTELR